MIRCLILIFFVLSDVVREVTHFFGEFELCRSDDDVVKGLWNHCNFCERERERESDEKNTSKIKKKKESCRDS